jgi:hypothetical protein
LEQLEEQLQDLPQRDTTKCYRPEGIEIDGSIGLYDWHTNDILGMRRELEEEFQMRAKFGHDTFYKGVTRAHNLKQEARQWVEGVWGIPPQNLKTRIYEETPGNPIVMIHEKFHSTEEYDNEPEVYLWLKITEQRYRQYPRQRVIDILYQHAIEENQEQLGNDDHRLSQRHGR